VGAAHETGGTPLANVGRGVRLAITAAGFRLIVPDRMRGSLNDLAANQQGARHAPKRNGVAVSRDELRKHARMRKVARRAAAAKFGGRPSVEQVRVFLGSLLDHLQRDGWRLPARRMLPRSALTRAWRREIDVALEKVFANTLTPR
jgi:hypothetical protein